jgi:hypothetical protein
MILEMRSHIRTAIMPSSEPDWSQLYAPIDAAPGSPLPAPTEMTTAAVPESDREISPGILQMATSFGTSMAKFVSGGFQTTTRKTYEERLAICQQCEHYSREACLICGCFLKPKLSMPHEQCPLGKWS